MRVLLILCACFILTACDTDAQYVDEKTLWDKAGCAFIARHNVGDTVMLYFNQDLSKETCKYTKEG